MADRERARENTSITGIILRVVLTAVVVGIAAFLTPGFTIDNLWSLIVAGVIIALLDYAIERIAGLDASPFGRGIVGFILTAVILYATSLFVEGFNISMLGAIVGALAVGIIDMVIPGKAM